MKIIVIGLIMSVLAVHGNKDHCHYTKEIEPNCGNYCFKAVKPVLDYTRFMQSQMEDLKTKTEYLDKIERLQQQFNKRFDEQQKMFEKSEQQIETRLNLSIEQKFEDLRQLNGTKTDRGPFQKIGSKYYYIEQSENLTWIGALHKCLTLGGHLVSIKKKTEFDAVCNQLQPRKYYWTDINDLVTEGEFLSVTTGFRATYFNWKLGNPDNFKNEEHCVELVFVDNVFVMNDANCTDKQRYICEHDKL